MSNLYDIYVNWACFKINFYFKPFPSSMLFSCIKNSIILNLAKYQTDISTFFISVCGIINNVWIIIKRKRSSIFRKWRLKKKNKNLHESGHCIGWWKWWQFFSIFLIFDNSVLVCIVSNTIVIKRNIYEWVWVLNVKPTNARSCASIVIGLLSFFYFSIAYIENRLAR